MPWLLPFEPNKEQTQQIGVYFPIEAPVMVLHVDAYTAGSHTGFKGSKMYLVACCGMCTFGALKPVSGANATTFASAIMKIQFCYRFCHTIILDRVIFYITYIFRNPHPPYSHAWHHF